MMLTGWIFKDARTINFISKLTGNSNGLAYSGIGLTLRFVGPDCVSRFTLEYPSKSDVLFPCFDGPKSISKKG